MGIGVKSAHWKVDDNEIYLPSMKTPTNAHDNIVTSDSGRTEDGFMHIHWVRSDVRQITLAWNRLTGDEMKYLRGLMQGKEFVLTFWDAGVTTMNAYCGKFTETLESEVLHESEGGVYVNIQATITEM